MSAPRIAGMVMVAAAVMLVSGAVAAPMDPGTPLVQYDFEGDPGSTVATYTGSYQSVYGSALNMNLYNGPSGQGRPVQGQYSGTNRPGATTGMALWNENTGTTMGGNGGRARTGGTRTGPFGNLESFTIAGWILTPSGQSDWSSAFVFTNHKNDQGLAVRGFSNSLVLYVDQADGGEYGSDTGSNGYYTDGRWTYFAITWDGSDADQPAKFYRGREQGFSGDLTTLIDTDILPDTTTDLGKVDVASWYVSLMNEAGGSRALDGRLDAFAIWGQENGGGGALSIDQIEGYRLASQGLPIPEPATIVVLAGAAIGLVRRARR